MINADVQESYREPVAKLLDLWRYLSVVIFGSFFRINLCQVQFVWIIKGKPVAKLLGIA